jgi:hypothetical protein
MPEETETYVEQLKEEMTQKLPYILADFKKVLENYDIKGARVAKFILVPDNEPEQLVTPPSIVECNEDICVISH